MLIHEDRYVQEITFTCALGMLARKTLAISLIALTRDY